MFIHEWYSSIQGIWPPQVVAKRVFSPASTGRVPTDFSRFVRPSKSFFHYADLSAGWKWQSPFVVSPNFRQLATWFQNTNMTDMTTWQPRSACDDARHTAVEDVVDVFIAGRPSYYTDNIRSIRSNLGIS